MTSSASSHQWRLSLSAGQTTLGPLPGIVGTLEAAKHDNISTDITVVYYTAEIRTGENMAACYGKVLWRTVCHDAEESPQRACAPLVPRKADAGARARRRVVRH